MNYTGMHVGGVPDGVGMFDDEAYTIIFATFANNQTQGFTLNFAKEDVIVT